jgi:hypothetical protein
MAITYRPMRPPDVHECVEIVAASPVQAARYGAAIYDLETAWKQLLGREALRAVVLEETENHSKPKKVGLGVSSFISDDFLHVMKTPPFVWVYPELLKRIANGDSPLLSDKQTREANADGGLNLFVWEGARRAEYEDRPEVLNGVLSAFLEQHRGFLLKELISHGNSIERVKAMLRTGGQFLNEDGKYVDQLQKPLNEVFELPHYIGSTREVALSRLGSWVGVLFLHEPARFGFRLSEQRLLLTALRGGTDQELSDELGISLSAVKKTWLSIYDRVSPELPGFSSNREHLEGTTERGKEKKQRLLNYLRDHPEELRPASP